MIINWNGNFLVIGYTKYITKIDFICFFYFFSVASRILKAIDVPQTIFLLDSAVLAIDISQADLPPGPAYTMVKNIYWINKWNL